MYTVDISVSRADVVKEIKRGTSYIGTKRDGAVGYNIIRATDIDDTALDKFWKDARADITDAFHEYLVKEEDGDDIVFTIQLPDNWNPAFEATLAIDVRSYMINCMTSQWLTYSNSLDDAKRYALMADSDMTSMRAKIYFRLPVYRRERKNR